MARAETVTWLSLDRFFEIIGTDPLHANGIYTELRPMRSGCEDTWMQYDWQNVQQVSRESLAVAIRDAEQQIANYVGYNLLPDWEIDERHNTVRPANPNLISSGYNIQGRYKSVRTDKYHVISGGQKAKTLIEAGAAIVRNDVDGDGYAETCTVTVATTITDTNEIRAYFPGMSGADEWEIRPLKTITANGVNAVLTFKIWQVVDPDLQEALNASGVDGDITANFESTADVYRVYNDPQTQVQLLWEPFPSCACTTGTCTVCQKATQTGCLNARDYRLGMFAYSPATWNATTETFTEGSWSQCRDPEQLRLWYYAGWRDQTRNRPNLELDPYWEKAIAYFAIALMDREICECDNVLVFWQNWQKDLSRLGSEVSFNISLRDLDNPFGTRQGAIYAWRRVNQEGRKIPR